MLKLPVSARKSSAAGLYLDWRRLVDAATFGLNVLAAYRYIGGYALVKGRLDLPILV